MSDLEPERPAYAPLLAALVAGGVAVVAAAVGFAVVIPW